MQESPSSRDRRAKLTQAFVDAEASLRIEGFEPAADPRYREIKAQLIAGTITFDQAEEAIKTRFAPNVRDTALAASA